MVKRFEGKGLGKKARAVIRNSFDRGQLVEGSALFWSSGAWLLPTGQLLVIVVALILYVYQGKQERKAEEQQAHSAGRNHNNSRTE
jgi:hypothetical protein